jgi:hypothetical protein
VIAFAPFKHTSTVTPGIPCTTFNENSSRSDAAAGVLAPRAIVAVSARARPMIRFMYCLPFLDRSEPSERSVSPPSMDITSLCCGGAILHDGEE